MIDGIPSWLFDTATPGAALVIVVIFIFTGRLIPLVYYRELKQDRDRWRTVAEQTTTSVKVFSDAFPELLEVGKTTTKVMTDIREKSEATEATQ